MSEPLSSIRAVIFDFGNVLTMPQDESRIEEMSRLAGLDREQFLSAYRRLRLDYDRGTLDVETYWKEVLRSGGVAEARVAELNGEFVRSMTDSDIASWMVIRPSTVGWAKALKSAGLKTAILSNMPSEHADYIRRSFPWLEDFDVKVFSYDVGLIKPEAAIYEECIRRLGVKPSESIFVDDIQVNVEAAKKVGINGVFFHDPDDVLVELRRFPGLPLPVFDDGSNES